MRDTTITSLISFYLFGYTVDYTDETLLIKREGVVTPHVYRFEKVEVLRSD